MDQTTKTRVGVIFGGMSAEKEVSLATGRYVYSLIDQLKYQPIALYMSYDGRIYHIPDKLVIQNKTEDIENRLEEAKEIKYEELKELVDLMFVALLGKYGEDGVIQGLLELLRIPYTGSGILSSGIAMDKKLTYQILQSSGVLIPANIVISQEDWVNNTESILNEIDNKLGYPVVTKPTREGSSIGVNFSDTREKLKENIEQTFKWDKEILAEQYIKGIEFMCVILGNENPAAMIPSEVSFEGPVHTYESKYMPGKAQYYTPARTEKDNIEKVKEIALKVYNIFGLKGYGRVDGFIVDDKVYIGEVHTGTIMVPSSYVFQQVSRTQVKGFKTGLKNGLGKVGKVNVGLTPKSLITTILDLAIDAHNHKKGTLQ